MIQTQTMRNWIDKLYTIWKSNSIFISVLFLLNFLTGAINNCQHEVGFSVCTKLIHGFVNVFFCSYLVAVVKDILVNRYWRTCITILSLVISFILFIVELFLILDFNMVINPSIVLIAFETNEREALEFFQTYSNAGWLLLMCLFVLFFLIRLIRHEHLCAFSHGIKESNFVKNSFFGLLLLGVFAAGYRYVKDSKNGAVISPHMKTMLPVQRLYYSCLITYHDLQEFETIASQMSHKEDEILVNHSQIKNIVLVIGESLSRNHMSLYGYPLQTTPHLDSLYQEGQLSRFNDVICPRLYTSVAIKRILSFYNNDSGKKWYEYGNLIDVMKNAGYKTYWISNQEMMGVYGNYVASLGQRCDEYYFNHMRNSIDEKYGDFDEELIPVLQEKLKDTSEKKLIVLHLMGSHPLYRNRYPKEYELFTKEDEKLPYADSSVKMAAEYDNTVLYNDHVMMQVVESLHQEEAVMFYLSDHGNEAYDFRDYTGRSEDDITRYMLEIPLLVWESPLFKANYPAKDSCIRASVDRPYMTDDFIHSLLDLSDIQARSFEPGRSIFNERFNASRPRVIQGYNYDKQKDHE